MSLPVRASGRAAAAKSALGSAALPRRNEFLPAILQLQEEAPSPLPRMVLWTVLALTGALLLWAGFGKLDVVAVAEGRLVPKSQLRIVQPAEGGVLRELLVKEGERVRAGQVLARMDVRAAEADAGKGAAAYAYRAQLEPLTQELHLGEARHALLPGMQLTAEIKLAERTVLEYLLSPVQKIASEAGRER